MNQGKIGKAGSADEFHAVVGLLYEAALSAELWPQALRRMVDFIGNSGTHVWLMDEKSKAVHHTTHVGIPDRLMADYNGDKIRECPRVGNALSRPMAELLFDYQHLSERDIDRNEYYDWLRKTGDGIRYYLAARFPAADGLTGYQSLSFRKSEGHSQPEHVQRFSILLPHVQRALTISQRLGDSQLIAHSALDLLRHLKFSVALLG
ncbi:MAG: hypothetical protein R3F24_00805 [Gammaproteobacteria bacterium]